MANIEIGGRLHSTATGNVVTGANEVLDDNKNKKQSDINAETDASLADRYTKAETYSKTELNNMITTPNQEYVTVDAYASLPATGSKDTVYRVSNYNGTTGQADASVYSEYAWNGSQYVHLSTKTQIGEVFDISAYHATGGTLATYADLSAALDSNNGGGVPQSLQEGGMSVKFVQSSDNKYVQFRCMANAFTTDVTQWQGVDNEPIAGSDNMVKSGGVAKEIKPLFSNVTKPSDNILFSNDYVQEGDSLFYNFNVSPQTGAIGFYDDNDVRLERIGGNEGNYKGFITIPNNFSYAKVIYGPIFIVSIAKGSVNNILDKRIKETDSKLSLFEGKTLLNFQKINKEIGYILNEGEYIPDTILFTADDVNKYIYYHFTVSPQTGAIKFFDINDVELERIGGNEGEYEGYINIPNDFSYAKVVYGTINIIEIHSDIEPNELLRNNQQQDKILREFDLQFENAYDNIFIDKTQFNYDGYFINSSNTRSNTNNWITCKIHLVRNQQIVFKCNGNGGFQYPFVETDETESYYKVVGDAFIEYDTSIVIKKYIAYKDCYIILQSATRLSTQPYDNIAIIINTTHSSIFDYNKDFIFSNLIKQAKQRKGFIAEGQILRGYTPISFAHFSDLHGDSDNLKRIIEFTAKYKLYLNDIIHTGDSVTNKITDDFTFWSESNADNILNVIGNHDVWKGNAWATKQEAYNKFFNPFINRWNVVQPENASTNGYCYYYKDYNTVLRLIVVDCMNFDSTQQSWLSSTLDSAGTMGVVIAIHYQPGKVVDNNYLFNSNDLKSSEDFNYLPSIIPIVKDFIDNGGHFICYLTGHTHNDAFGVLPDDIRQTVVTVENAGVNDAWNDSVRLRGEKSQDCFNLIFFDVTAKEIKIIRVGNDYDRQLRHKKTMCYNYNTHTIISE